MERSSIISSDTSSKPNRYGYIDRETETQRNRTHDSGYKDEDFSVNSSPLASASRSCMSGADGLG